jgi:hypothetical protein
MNVNNNQSTEMNTLENALRVRICGVCVDRNLSGACLLEQERECALFSSFPKIVQAVSQVRSNLLEDYVEAIRKTVCSQCIHQDEFGICRVREEVRCVLDRYLMLIVQTIEEFQGIRLQPIERNQSVAPAPWAVVRQPEVRKSAVRTIKERSDA